MKPTRLQRFLRACISPALWLCCWKFPECPNCQSIDGFVTGHRGDNGKECGYPDYARPTIKGYYCQRCGYKWERPYRERSDIYYWFRYLLHGFMSYTTYRRLLARFDYSYPASEQTPSLFYSAITYAMRNAKR